MDDPLTPESAQALAGTRKALRIDRAKNVSVLVEGPVPSEAFLHRAIADHPEVLPCQDFGLGPLMSLGSEVPLESGSLDLLLADAQGRLALCEFKKGSENRDVRKVTAQMLDYGASLWHLPFSELERSLQRSWPGFTGSLVDYVRDIAPVDEAAFVRGAEECLERGTFVFLYVARDLDPRTRRIMTYLAEGPRMSFFAVEVDHYEEGDSGVLVPRTAFVPSWVREKEVALTDPDADALTGLMDSLAVELGITPEDAPTGKRYRGRSGAYIGVYGSSRGIEFGMRDLRNAGSDDLADALLERMETLLGRKLQGKGEYPKFRCITFVSDWKALREGLIVPFLNAD